MEWVFCSVCIFCQSRGEGNPKRKTKTLIKKQQRKAAELNEKLILSFTSGSAYSLQHDDDEKYNLELK